MKAIIILAIVIILVLDVVMLYSCIRINRVKARRPNNGKKHM